MKTKAFQILCSLTVLFLPVIDAVAAPPPPPPTPVPIDGGLSLVVAGCIGYGAKKIYDKKKK